MFCVMFGADSPLYEADSDSCLPITVCEMFESGSNRIASFLHEQDCTKLCADLCHASRTRAVGCIVRETLPSSVDPYLTCAFSSSKLA